MKIGRDKFVHLEFELKDDEGNTLDSSSSADPVGYLHGGGTLVSGLENHLEGKRAGDEFAVSLEPKDGFGERDESRVFEVPKSELGPGISPTRGTLLSMQDAGGAVLPVVVAKVKVNSVVLDANPAFAGMNLHFSGRVTEVRNANKDELRGCCGGCTVD